MAAAHEVRAAAAFRAKAAAEVETKAAAVATGNADLDLGKLCLKRALSLDEKDRGKDALPLYISAVQQYLDGMKRDQNDRWVCGVWCVVCGVWCACACA